MSESAQADARDWAERGSLGNERPVYGVATEPKRQEYGYHETGDTMALYAALAVAQGSFRTAKKTSANPHFKSKFAPLEEVIAATQEGLAANGLAVIQPAVMGPDGWLLITKLTHAGGGAIETMVPVGNFGTVQELASKLTYLKRYTRSALLSVASDEDDDGNEATEGDKSAPRDRSKPAAPPKAAAPAKPPSKPQDAPKPPEAPPRPAPVQSAPQPKSEPPPAPNELLATADKLAEMKSLLVALQFKGTPAKELIELVTGKTHALINNADVDTVQSVLQKAFDSKWDADRLMLLVRETPDAATAIRTIEEETAVMGGV